MAWPSEAGSVAVARLARPVARLVPAPARSRILRAMPVDPARLTADALRVYLTGAVSDGGDQADPDASLGGFRASTEARSFGVVGAVQGLTVLRVGEGAVAGVANLEVDASGNAAWRGQGETARGALTTLPINADVVLPTGGAQPASFVRVRRTAVLTPGARALHLVDLYNGVVGLGNVANAARAAGDVRHRALMLRNVAPYPVALALASSQLDLASETPVAGAIQTIATDDVAPAGLSWAGTAAVTLAPGDSVGLWIRRTITAGASGAARVENEIEVVATPPRGTAWTFTLRGCYRIEESALARYELYRGIDADPDLNSSPWETFTSLPHDTAELGAGHAYRFVLRRRNAYGLVSANAEESTITVAASGAQAERPSAPDPVTADPAAGGTVRVRAAYEYELDAEAVRATHWAVWVAENADPNPNLTPTYTEALVLADGVGKLDWTSAAFSHGADVRVLVRTRRTAGAINTDSDNALVLRATADAVGPVLGASGTFLGRAAEQQG